MQNTIVKEFEDNPEVVTVLLNSGGHYKETLSWMFTLWDNYYLRGPVMHDSTASASTYYTQPGTGLPFGRNFIIDRDGTIVTPYFGHSPKLAINTIYELLGTSSVDNGPNEPGSRIWLEPGRPNPFTSGTTIRYSLPAKASVSLRIFDLRGRVVRTIFERVQESGRHEAAWDGMTDTGTRAASGVYLCRLSAARESGSPHSETIKVILLQ
jgi:hypothetical protein